MFLNTRNRNLSDRDQYINAFIGLSGEAGECLDLMKKVVFHGHIMNSEKLLEELGDVRYYLEYIMSLYGFTMEQIEQNNINKLMTRYPNGFSNVASIQRRDK
jgi:NTP pyrophosphatase (non-canonical NTP hydrolase)